MSWQMTFSLNGAAQTSGTSETNPYISVTSDNSASVIGQLKSGDVMITITAYDSAGGSDSAEFIVTTLNAHDITDSNTITPDMSTMSRVELTSEFVSRLREELSGTDTAIYSLFDEEGVTIDASERSLTEHDIESISKYSARMLFALPRITVSKSGYYVFCTSFKKYYAAGAPLQCLFNQGGSYIPFNISGYYLDEDEQSDGTVYYTVPEDQYVVTAAYFEAGSTYWGYFVAPAGIDSELPVRIIEPVAELSPDVLMNIAREISVDVSEIRLLTAEELSDPQEPTKAMRDEAAKDNYKLAWKLDTITVKEDGYYVFAVNVPDELTSADAGRIYAFTRDFAGSSVSSSVLGILNGLAAVEEFNMMGLKINSLAGKILVAGFFQAGQSVCLYIARLIFWLLGFPACGVVSLAGAGLLSLGTAGIFILMRHIKTHRK